MSFLCTVAGLSIRDRVRSLNIREEFREEQLLLHVERSQLSLFGYLVKMPPVLGMLIQEKTPSIPWTCWRDYISRLSWENVGVPQDLVEMARKRSIWIFPSRTFAPLTRTRLSVRKQKKTFWYISCD